MVSKKFIFIFSIAFISQSLFSSSLTESSSTTTARQGPIRRHPVPVCQQPLAVAVAAIDQKASISQAEFDHLLSSSHLFNIVIANITTKQKEQDERIVAMQAQQERSIVIANIIKKQKEQDERIVAMQAQQERLNAYARQLEQQLRIQKEESLRILARLPFNLSVDQRLEEFRSQCDVKYLSEKNLSDIKEDLIRTKNEVREGLKNQAALIKEEMERITMELERRFLKTAK